ncbi:MAG: serine protease [Calditrichaceae bacterium]
MKWMLRNIVIFLMLATTISCVNRIHRYEGNQIVDGKYDSEYPTRPVSEHLEKLTKSVKLISIFSIYGSYDIYGDRNLRKEGLSHADIKTNATYHYIFEKPATGTATIIYADDNKIAMLTCAHVVNFPDTVFSYFKDKFGKDTPYIRNVSIKERQNIHIHDVPAYKNFEIIAIDSEEDIALIGFTLEYNRPAELIPVLNSPTGRAEELDWGTRVYLIGYPRGKKIVSNNMVSSPNRDKKQGFIIDSVSPRGISGGLIFAVRDGVPNFEVVGMASAVAAESMYYLSPEKNFKMSDYDALHTYDGDAFVQTYDSVFYGITYALSIESVLKFIKENEPAIRSKGYNPDRFFGGNINFERN